MVGQESALLVAVPAAENAVGRFRTRLDSGAAMGVPAHITVLYPFIPPAAITNDDLQRLSTLFQGVSSFEIALESVGWFGEDVAFVAPRPDGDLRRLTAMVAELWPDWPPYGGLHGEPTPHLTIGDNADVSALRRAADAVATLLPISTTVTEVQLFTGDLEPETWQRLMSFPLAEPRGAPGQRRPRPHWGARSRGVRRGTTVRAAGRRSGW